MFTELHNLFLYVFIIAIIGEYQLNIWGMFMPNVLQATTSDIYYNELNVIKCSHYETFITTIDVNTENSTNNCWYYIFNITLYKYTCIYTKTRIVLQKYMATYLLLPNLGKNLT